MACNNAASKKADQLVRELPKPIVIHLRDRGCVRPELAFELSFVLSFVRLFLGSLVPLFVGPFIRSFCRPGLVNPIGNAASLRLRCVGPSLPLSVKPVGQPYRYSMEQFVPCDRIGLGQPYLLCAKISVVGKNLGWRRSRRNVPECGTACILSWYYKKKRTLKKKYNEIPEKLFSEGKKTDAQTA